jgi:hypothetical protein
MQYIDNEPNSCVSETQSSNNRDRNVCKKGFFMASETFPDCWTEKQYGYFTSENSWVEVKDKMLGCHVCREVSEVGMGTQKGAGINFAKEWVEYRVNSNGGNRSKKQSSLRKKIHVHKTSIHHTACKSIKAECKKVLLETVVDNMNAKRVETTFRVLHTVYKIAKQSRPFNDLPVDVELQELNGLNMGRVLHFNYC